MCLAGRDRVRLAVAGCACVLDNRGGHWARSECLSRSQWKIGWGAVPSEPPMRLRLNGEATRRFSRPISSAHSWLSHSSGIQQPERIPIKGAMKLIQFLTALAILAVAGPAQADAASAQNHAKSAKVLLGVFAHPDDETTCAGVLARAAASGWEVRVIFATSGDAGSDVSGRNLKGAALGREREREGACALATLGVKRPPIWLSFGDGTLARSRSQVRE